MAVRINNITISLDEERGTLLKIVREKLNIKTIEDKDIKILKESIDARKKDNIKFIYSLEINVKDKENKIANLNDNNIKVIEDAPIEELIHGNKKMNARPIIVGLGPAGLFAALTLAKNGYRPIIFEMGEDIEARTQTVQDFWNGKTELKTDSNVQFGEGGAGTFSDGKLTTRIKDFRCTEILEEFVKAGAPEDIMYIGKPHVGTDILKGVVKNIRNKIISLGGEVHFNSKVSDIIIEDGRVKKIKVNKEDIPCENLIMAIGHSARDTYEMMFDKGIFMESKALAIGVRIEHPQQLINESQYGKYANHPKLKAADYRLTHKSDKMNRGVYSFCMCPGGEVVAAASEKEGLVSNGMSYHARNSKNGNSALVVTVSPKDYGNNNPLSGIKYQRHYEKLAYKYGGGDYKAPIQLVGDFLKDRKSNKIGKVNPSYRLGYEYCEMKKILPIYVIDTLKEGIIKFDRRIKGYAMDDAVIMGIETRTSAPVRICRNEVLESISTKGLYPAGEGSGFAGGIISAAVDGIKVAENIIREYSEK